MTKFVEKSPHEDTEVKIRDMVNSCAKKWPLFKVLVKEFFIGLMYLINVRDMMEIKNQMDIVVVSSLCIN